jgi:hypothetical protein
MLINLEHLFDACLGLILNFFDKTQTANDSENCSEVNHHKNDIDVVYDIEAPLLPNYSLKWHKTIIKR